MSVLKLKPACKDYLWGGERLRTEFCIPFAGRPLAEAWVLSGHPDGPSVIENGPWAGRTLPEYIAEAGPSVLGTGEERELPILIKLIDAARDLSVQVHPSDKYALVHENQQGKTEAWYILDAQPGARLYYGFRGTPSPEEVAAAVKEGTLPDLLRAVPVHKGDLFFIPPGTVHAIGAGILLAEIQQSSNVTYRLYDYNRLGPDGQPRPLHLEKALAVADCRPPEEGQDFGPHLVRCGYFTADRLEAPCAGLCGEESFTSLVVLEGTGTLVQGTERLSLAKGDSLFLPAGSGAYRVEGDCMLLKTALRA